MEVTGQEASCLHEVQDVVAALDHLTRGRDLQLDLGAFLAFLHLRIQADRLGVLEEVELGGGLGDGCQDGELGQGQFVELLAEVAPGRRLDSVRVVPVEVVVQIGGDDLLLALVTRVGLGQPDGLDDLADLAVVRGALECRGREQAIADQLLGDRRPAAWPAGQRIQTGADDGSGVEPGIDPEVPVLDRGGRVQHLARDLVERHDFSSERTEPRQFHLARPVVDDRLLVEIQAAEGGLGIRQALRVIVVGGHSEDRPDGSRQQAEDQEDEWDRDEDPAKHRPALTLWSTLQGAPMALPPRESRLHLFRTIA